MEHLTAPWRLTHFLSRTLTSCCCVRPCGRPRPAWILPAHMEWGTTSSSCLPPEHPKPTSVDPSSQQVFFVPWALIFVTQPLVQGTFSIDVYRLSGWSLKHSPTHEGSSRENLVANGRYLINIQIPSWFQAFHRSSSLLDPNTFSCVQPPPITLPFPIQHIHVFVF